MALHMDYPTSMDGYQILGRIGKGAFASVFVATCAALKTKLAIKVIELELSSSPLATDIATGQTAAAAAVAADEHDIVSLNIIQKEAAIMTRMNHANVVSCYMSFTAGTELWLVMPLLVASCHDIMSTIKELQHGLMDEVLIASMMRDVLNGLSYIHHDGRVHRDIKAGNILVSRDGVCQISDFGVSGAIIEGGLRKNGRHTFTGSLWWMSPEVLHRESRHSYSTDIWSVGITALELAFGKPPRSAQRPVKVMLTILQKAAPTVASCIEEHSARCCGLMCTHDYSYSKKCRDFLTKCLQKDPSKRLSASNLLNHAFIKQARGSDYVLHHIVSKYHLDERQRIADKDCLPHSVQARLAGKASASKPAILSNSFDFDSELSSATSHTTAEACDSSNAKVGRFDVAVEKKLHPNTTEKGRFRITAKKHSVKH